MREQKLGQQVVQIGPGVGFQTGPFAVVSVRTKLSFSKAKRITGLTAVRCKFDQILFLDSPTSVELWGQLETMVSEFSCSTHLMRIGAGGSRCSRMMCSRAFGIDHAVRRLVARGHLPVEIAIDKIVAFRRSP